MISLPTATPAITEVELTMETGQPPNLTTVVKTFDVADIAIGEYITVLSSADTGWQEGTWIAQIRFRNSVGYGPYSDVKSDTVPTRETCIWQDVSPSETRNRVEGEWTDTGRTRENPVTLIVEKEQTRTITWEKKQQCTSDSATHYQWVPDSRTETRWVEYVPCTWVDVDPPETQNIVEGQWMDTGNQRENQVLLIIEKEQTRTITWEKKQQCTSDSATHYQWVSDFQNGDSVGTEIRLATWEDVDPPETQNRVEGQWMDTGRTQQDPVDDSWEKEQQRTITWEKKQQCTSDSATHYQWVNASRTETRWVPDTPCEWVDVSPPEIRNRAEGSWSDTDETRWVATERIFERKQTRVVTWEKKQECTSHDTTHYQWVRTSTTQTQWVEIIEVCRSWSDTGRTRVDRYGSWSRTGRTRNSGANRECQERRTVYREKQQSCTTNPPYNNTQYRWVSTSSTTATQLGRSCPLP